MLSRWEVPRDIARARVLAVRFGAGHPVFRVGPSDRPPRVEGDATVLVLDGEHPHRRRELDLIVQREGDGEWHGERDIDPAHRWEHTQGVDRDGVDVLMYVDMARYDPSITAVVVKSGGMPTALVLITLDPPDTYGACFHASWDEHIATIKLLSTADDAPKGHAALAMAHAMTYARERGRKLVCLSALSTAVAYYLNNCFGGGVHAFLIETEDAFERSRTYALSSSTSARDYVDIARLINETVHSETVPTVAFVLHGKDALAGLDYERIIEGPPPLTPRAWLGRHVLMSRVSARTPLVVGRTYEAILETEQPRRTQALTGYVVHTTRLGHRKFVGELVQVGRRRGTVASWGPGEVATFANGILGRFVDITFDASIAFRRTVRTHPVVDIDAAELVRLRVDELPDAATLNFE